MAPPRRSIEIPDYRQQPLDAFVEDLAHAVVPAGGSAAAASAALAAALTAKIAARSRAEESADRAAALRERLVGLVTVDAASYAEALQERNGGTNADAATAAAARPPASTAGHAAEVAEIARTLVDVDDPALRVDAWAALRIAVAAAEAAGEIAVAGDGSMAERVRADIDRARRALQTAERSC